MGITGKQAGDWFRASENNWHGQSNFSTADVMVSHAVRDKHHPALGPFQVPREDLQGAVDFFGRADSLSPIPTPWDKDLRSPQNSDRRK